MTWKLNGIDRDLNTIKVKAPRKIQEEAITRVTETCKTSKRLLLNMPCRTGKTFTTLYGAYQAGIELVIVLCGKTSAKSSYETDSVWKDTSGCIHGFNQVIVNNKALNAFFANPVLETNETAVIELTPQLLNRHPEYTEVLKNLAATRKTLFAFDEAHFAERTKKTQDMITTITAPAEDEVDTDKLTEAFGIIPWIYITASPDTVSIQNQFDENSTYEVTKEYEWELYLEDLTRPLEAQEFNYVPVRNCLYIMNRLMNSVFDSATGQKQDYTSLFTQKIATHAAKAFVKKSLLKVIEVINHGPEDSYMVEDETAPYSRRGSNINLMIKAPVNKNTKAGESTVSEQITTRINDVKSEILAAYPEFTEINVLDATLANTVGQAQANEFFDSHPTAINIIITRQRLIEGATLYNLDGFLYYCNSGSLVDYKQESGRTLNPTDNKRFGFIFFFDEEALSCVKAVLAAKLRKIKGKKHGPRKLSTSVAKKMTRINPAFIMSGNDEMKLIDYSQSLYSKSDFERTRTRETLFDKEQLFSIPGLFDLIQGLLGKMSGNTTKKTKSDGTGSGGNGTGNSTPGTSNKKNTVTKNTPKDQIEIEKFVYSIIYTYQDCIQSGIDCEAISKSVLSAAYANGIPVQACELLYDNDYTREVLMEIYEVLLADQNNINPEDYEDDNL